MISYTYNTRSDSDKTEYTIFANGTLFATVPNVTNAAKLICALQSYDRSLGV